MNATDMWTAIIGIASVVVIAITPRFSKKIPGSLIAIILMTVVALLLKNFAGVSSIETIGDRFSISSELPEAHVPAMTWETIKQLVSPAITIAILGAIESLLSATVADGVIGDHHDSNTELIAQGVANLASPLFGGIPATGAIAEPEYIICVCHKRHVLCISKQLQLLCVVLQRHLPAWRNIHGRDAHTARHDEKEKEKLKTGRATLLLKE